MSVLTDAARISHQVSPTGEKSGLERGRYSTPFFYGNFPENIRQCPPGTIGSEIYNALYVKGIACFTGEYC